MDENIKEKVMSIRRKTEQCLKNTGFDENLIRACDFHLDKVLQRKNGYSKIKSREQYVNVLMSNLFMDKIELYPTKRFKSKVNENSSWPLHVVPSELFAENAIPIETRKYVFYKCLRVGDFLDCRVTSSCLDSVVYQLTVIHKYGVTRILDDLNFNVIMRKADINELPQALKEFAMDQLVRVVVTEKGGDDTAPKVFVSVIHSHIDFKSPKPQLGTISENVLPHYTLNPHLYKGKFPSYKDYLISNPGFYDPLVLKEIYQEFEIDPRGNYSYFPVDERLSSINVDATLKECKLKDVKEYMNLALDKFSKEKFSPAMVAIDLAIQSFPEAVTEKDKEELSKLYDIKSTIQDSEKKSFMSEDSLSSLLKALSIDKTNNSAKENLSKNMSYVAIKYYKKKKDYCSAARWASQALRLNENNALANELMEYLKKKHPEAVDEFDDESIQALLEKHKAIGSELQKLTGEMSVPLIPY